MSTDEREPLQDLREGIRTPQAFAVPVVGGLVVWLTTVASNLLYVVAGALLFVVTVAMSMETVDPRTIERRLYPGAAVALIVLGGLAVATGQTNGYTAAGALARGGIIARSMMSDGNGAPQDERDGGVATDGRGPD